MLRDDGTVWLNLGDAYSGSQSARAIPADQGGSKFSMAATVSEKPLATELTGLPGPKNLMGQPWRVAFALQDDGWLLRSAIVWHKPNPMPESVRDRPTNAYEMIFLLAKQGQIFLRC